MMTVAGNGVNGYTGDGGPAINAGVPYPLGVCVDASGNLYISCYYHVRKVEGGIPTGIISNYAGDGTIFSSGDGGPAVSAGVNHPWGLWCDKYNNIYLAEPDGSRVRKISASGIITTVAGNGTAGYSGDGGLATNASLKKPIGVAVDNAGNIYIADADNYRVRKVDANTGIITTVAGTGVQSYTGDGGPAVDAGIWAPLSICVDKYDNVYFTEVPPNVSSRIRKIEVSTGMITTVGGTGPYGYSGDGGPVTSASFFGLTGIAIDPLDNIYVSETDGGRIRRIDAVTKIVTTYAGTGVNSFYDGDGIATTRRLYYPRQLAFDAKGDLYVADENNLMVRKITKIPLCTPTITIQSSQSGPICTGSAINFTTTVANEGSAPVYQWVKNGTNVGSNSPTYSDNNLQNGDKIYCKLASNSSCANGLVATSNTITISGSATNTPLPSITISKLTPMHCFNVGDQFSATVTGSASNMAYQWKRNGVNAGINSANFLGGVLNVNDVITCELSGTNSCGGSFTVVSNSITVQSNPGYDLSPEVTTVVSQQAICEGTSVTFTATNKSGNANPQYQWLVNGAGAGITSPTFSTSTLTNNAVVTCIMTVPECNNAGSTKDASDPITMTVYSTLNPSISISASATTICKGTQVTFTATASQGGNSPGYQWKLNGIPVGANTASYVPATLNDGDVITCEYTVDPSASCVKSSKVTSNSIAMKVLSATAPSLQISGSPIEICSGASVRFNATSDNPTMIASYQWRVNGATVGTGTSFTTSALKNADQVSCMATLNSGSCTSSVPSNTIAMVVHPVPSVSFASPNITIIPSSQIQLKPSVQGDITSHQWAPSNLLTDPSSLSPNTVALSNNTSFQLVVTTAYGCTDEASIVVWVYSKLYMPNSFSPNGDGHNDVFRVPNNVPLDLKEFSIYDRWGTRVFTTKDITKGWDGRTNGALQNSGTFIYVVRGRDSNGEVNLKGTVTLIR
jgi:gliding motility-associated-like protein